MGQEIVIGRSSELDMVLVEDMVSRRHARITAQNGELEIEDFGSTNGTFVNGKKVKTSKLEEGDRILIGTSIIKLVEQEEPLEDTDRNLEVQNEQPTQHGAENPTTGQQSPVGGPTEPENMDQGGGAPEQKKETQMGEPAVGAGQPGQSAPDGGQGGGQGGATLTGSISGLIEEVPLPDLLQLFSTSQKSGVLVVHSDDIGKVYLRDGRVYYATINDDPDISPHKAFYRMLAWEEGTFSLEQAEDASFEDEIDESIENLLMEGMRQLDEIRNLGDDVPDFQDDIDVNKPLVPPLRSLTDELLDTLQLVYNYGKVSTVLNKSLASDLETMQDIVHLMRKDYISVQE
ncbi:MAG: DUF4388 domain-containing protein [Bradymonadaceae bacterium]